ncbi:ABC transporter substrate-binding protein [Modicisalibacter tunisiensis]|uniref:MlaC/ttg2D family ABC transporter substrate-binding protein n=1 Tax=Modicisalibacter tunisiensis TaxID=390637 RepID=UPI001CCB7B89|nr:ABC transporter substrate-binding protein [Modicisalibacter tunisiensis]MBZ9538472.1 ABC transporter substrate-binding protein [Modicisalibacter tunisiensis]
MKTIARRLTSFGWLAVLLLAGSLVTGQAALAEAQNPEQMIRDSINQLMGKLEGRKDYYAQHTDELEALVDDSLQDVADFHYIAASVMGRYFRNASPEQRSRFARTFRQTLVDTYAKGLVTFDYRDLRVVGSTTGRYEDQSSVDMEVVADDGKVYPVNYTLRRTNDGQWKVVNVIVNGINLGLTFRNQFDQAMRDRNRDYDAVISNWAPEVGTDELEKGSQG